jgi:hypothetical protein
MLGLVACSPHTIEGTVMDIQGQTVPGVAVTVEETESQAVSDAVGKYKVVYEPGKPAQVKFAKTGYTPGVLYFSETPGGRIDAADVYLWVLPQQKGVYFFENYRYRPTTAVEPEQFRLALEEGIAYGTRRDPEIVTETGEPHIFCYKFPGEAIRLNRLEPTDVRHADGATEEVFFAHTRGKPIPVVPEPIDDPRGMLVRLRMGTVLEPGTYGVHLGALDGNPDAPDSRMFYFTVATPEVEVIEEEAGETNVETPEAADETG